VGLSEPVVLGAVTYAAASCPGAARGRSCFQTDAVLDKEKSRYLTEMADEQTAFLEHLNSISLEVNGLARFADLKEVDKAASAVAVIKRQLEVRLDRTAACAGLARDGRETRLWWAVSVSLSCLWCVFPMVAASGREVAAVQLP